MCTTIDKVAKDFNSESDSQHTWILKNFGKMHGKMRACILLISLSAASSFQLTPTRIHSHAGLTSKFRTPLKQCPCPLRMSTDATQAGTSGTSVGTDANLKERIADFYDQSSPLWEEVWGEHMHMGTIPIQNCGKMEKLQGGSGSNICMPTNFLYLHRSLWLERR